MKKTITIDNREIKLETNGFVPILYKRAFQSNFFADINKLSDELDFEVLMNLLYVFARIADKTIGDPEEWFSSFEELPIATYVQDISELATACLVTTHKEAKAKNGAKASKK